MDYGAAAVQKLFTTQAQPKKSAQEVASNLLDIPEFLKKPF
jgi:hypothetical protein